MGDRLKVIPGGLKVPGGFELMPKRRLSRLAPRQSVSKKIDRLSPPVEMNSIGTKEPAQKKRSSKELLKGRDTP